MKQYVKSVFDEGEKAGRKANPVAVSFQIRKERDENGNRLFRPCDWISAQQVRSLFAQFHMKQMKEKIHEEKRPRLELEIKTEEDEDLNEVLGEIDAIDVLTQVGSVTDQVCEFT